MNFQIDKTVSIGEAARLTGVSIKQVRHWHAQGYIPAPQRVICGERSYRQFGKEDLKFIHRLTGSDAWSIGIAMFLKMYRIIIRRRQLRC